MRCVQKCLSLKEKKKLQSSQSHSVCCCCSWHQNSNYIQIEEIHPFSSDSTKEERLCDNCDVFAVLVNLLFCGRTRFQPRFYCLSKPSWIKHHVVIFTARCCIISIIHKACARNLIPSVIFMAASAGRDKWNSGGMCIFVASLYDSWFIHHQSCSCCWRKNNPHCTFCGVHIQSRLNYCIRYKAQRHGRLSSHCSATQGPVVSTVATRGWAHNA